ncbi:hypothetical protein ZIOFF_003264 [Zingiber officinale]|uniref:Uncharacterized protein n=1 Tax=Zingiber officinale TaxID=94328 RepID=A0A8J5I943_ZINOF|nr:hypothetical protein ZIOFF_003264 [Zingiber officinale]
MSSGISCLQIWLPHEELALFSQSEGRNAHFDRGSRPASAAAMEGLKTVTTEEPDSYAISMMSAIMMEIYSIIFVPNTSLGVSRLQIWLSLEEFALFSQSEGRNNTHFDRGSRPASVAAVEGLKMVTAEELDS